MILVNADIAAGATLALGAIVKGGTYILGIGKTLLMSGAGLIAAHPGVCVGIVVVVVVVVVACVVGYCLYRHYHHRSESGGE